MLVDGHLFKDSFLCEDVSYCGFQLLTAGLSLQIEYVKLISLNLFQLLDGLWIAFHAICYSLCRNDFSIEQFLISYTLLVALFFRI